MRNDADNFPTAGQGAMTRDAFIDKKLTDRKRIDQCSVSHLPPASTAHISQHLTIKQENPLVVLK